MTTALQTKNAARPLTAALLVLFAALVLWRIPAILAGRFWAEEAVVYFVNALTLPWYAAWFAIHTGYINFAAGLATWIAAQCGLAAAPHVTVFLAFLVQCLPAYALLTHEFPWRGRVLPSLAVIILAALPPVTGEVWLNTITSQFHLALFAALVLAAPPPPRAGLRAADNAALVLAALSGPVTDILAPLFLARALLTRSRATILPAAIVAAGCALQGGVVLLNMFAARQAELTLAQLVTVFSVHSLVLPFAGFKLAQHFATWLAPGSPRRLLVGMAPFLLFYALAGYGVARARSATLAWLLAASALLGLVSFHFALAATFDGSMHVDGGQRYAFAPMVINAAIVVGLACVAPGRLRGVFAALTALLLLVTVRDARTALTLFDSGPAWAPQLLQHWDGPQRVFQAWPSGGWYFAIPNRAG